VEGGRGSGKSFAIAQWAVMLTYEKGHKILYTRYTLTSAESSIIPEFKSQIERMGVYPDFKYYKDKIVNTQTGVEILFKGIRGASGNQTARLKSIQGITTWIYDEFEEHPDEKSFNVIDLSIRTKEKPNRVVMVSNAVHKDTFQYKRFLEPIYRYGTNHLGEAKLITNHAHPNRQEILENHHTTVIHTTYFDNYKHLSKSFLDQAEEAKGTRRYDIDFLGIHYDVTDGALWTYDMFKRKDEINIKKLKKIVVAVDPAVSQDADSDLTGIVVVGKDDKDNYYVLGDYSDVYTPNQWARIAGKTYEQFQADEIVAESNNGGDLVESNIRAFNPQNISVKQVKATRGKFLRAEPIKNLYEQGKVYHIGNLYKLEQEMVTWSPEYSKKSPDRLDALVWGMSRLLTRRKPKYYTV
jgi:PBSX family phage terminase large subunit